jgi:hypothetical protein
MPDHTPAHPILRAWRSCSWCRTANLTSVATCRVCAHDAHRPRLQCTCVQCVPPPTDATEDRPCPAR